MEKKKIVVFGSTGNIGMYFIDYLLNNLDMNQYEVIATGRREKYPYNFATDIGYYQVDITSKADFFKLPRNNVYAVVDFAGLLPAYTSNPKAEDYINVNINGTLNVLEYCRESKVDRVIYTQTWADLNGYLSEHKPLEPYWSRKPVFKGDHAIYNITKCTAVDLTQHYFEEYGIKNFIFRLPNIYMYAPNMHYYVDGVRKYISYRYMIEKAILGEPIELWGNAEKGKDIIYIKDLCQMIYKSIFVNKNGGIYNAGTGIKTTMLEQIEGMIQVFSPKDNPSKIIHCPEKRDCDDFVMNIDNAKKDLGYEPEYSYIKYLEDYKRERELDRFQLK